MESDLHLEILPKRQRDLFYLLSKCDWISEFYLAGGTALALQIAHRRSIDFDFFTERAFDNLLIKKRVTELGDYSLRAENEMVLDGDLNGIRISFFKLPWRPIGKDLCFGRLRIAPLEEIAAMKLSSISMRGSRKDFIDFYFLLARYPLAKIVEFYEQKYGRNNENVYCALKGLVYFADAEKRPMPHVMRRVAWREIKNAMIKAHKNYIAGLNRQ